MVDYNNILINYINRIVIIGATGFIGSALLEYFNNCGITTLGISSIHLGNSEQAAINYLQDNICSDDVVFVLSAITPDKTTDSFDTFIKNVRIATIICTALKHKNLPNIIYFSSDAVYAFDNIAISETTRVSPDSLYGMMHAVREKMFQETFKDNLLIIRSTQVYGVSDTHNSYGPCRMLRSAIKENKIYLFGEGLETRDHIFIYDLVKITVLLLKNNYTGIVNAVTGVSVSFKYIAHLLSDIMTTKKLEVISVPSQNPVTYRQFDNSKMIMTLKNFKCLSIEDGLNNMYVNIKVGKIDAEQIV